jgi:cyclopropane-fatty-acyl-phospholipid synthase
MRYAMQLAIDWVEQGYLPDAVIRSGIRRLCQQRLRELRSEQCELVQEQSERFLQSMATAEAAPMPHLANAQHYEVPAEFFNLVLGPHRKYSCAWWPGTTPDLEQAEIAALTTTCQRAHIADGQRVLELGCGWGSLTLWIAERHPSTHITGVSNSCSQRAWILEEASRRGLSNITVVTADMNDFKPEQSFDRVVSVEMFEHMRNWRLLFNRVQHWLNPSGQFFLHVFCHRSSPYAFVDEGPADWMSRYFFSGGMMPSDDLPLRFQEDLRLVQRWRWAGTHYQKTANAWLQNLDRNRAKVFPLLVATYGEQAAAQWLQRWRIFFMACAETFGYRDGQEWWVGHYLFDKLAR